MIRFEDVCAGYGGREILHGINCELETGKLTAVIGPNGSGKSTLLKTVMGQTRLIRGKIFVEEKDRKQLSSRDAAQKIAYLPQYRSDSNITVERLVLHGRFPYLSCPRHYTAQDMEKAVSSLEQMGIVQLRHRVVSELSGGEKQKVYLAMALAQEAPVLLLDEPSTFLDISCQLELLHLLRGLKEEGKTVIMVLHELNWALQYADCLLLMQGGELCQYGTVEELLIGGRLEQVFGLRLHRLKDEEGRVQYFFSGR